jgi:hypothetical protein
MEAKIKHWMHRIFQDPSREYWSKRLPQMESEGSSILRFECFAQSSIRAISKEFQRWLGIGINDGNLAVSPPSMAEEVVYPIGSWKECFTEKTNILVQNQLGDLLSKYNYHQQGASACIYPQQPSPATPTAMGTTPEERLARFVRRVGALKVVDVDVRFQRFLDRSPKAAGGGLPRCTGKGCLPDFIAIGAQKGGTTSLHYYLEKYHSGIETSIKEELNFFTER